MLRYLLIAAVALAAGPVQAAPPVAAPDTMSARLQACTACHGQEGRATVQGYFPRIAGKPAGYLFHQLQHFREGRRINATMTYLLEHMTDDYLREIARHFAALDLPYATPRPSAAPAAQLMRGEALVRVGDVQRGLPACTACHGAAMTGVAPAVPGLLGLPRDYLIAQLGAWQTGQRRAHAPDCMAQVAQRLSPEDLGAVATWLAAQPLPADPHPAPRSTQALPLACGEAPR